MEAVDVVDVVEAVVVNLHLVRVMIGPEQARIPSGCEKK